MNDFITYKTESHTVCFGNKYRSVLSCEQFANRPLVFAHQVHGCELYNPTQSLNPLKQTHSQSITKPCDALSINTNKFALGVYTADCIPCFVVQDNQLFSIHLGWRGVYLKLLSKVLQGIDLKKDFYVYIGPHIQLDSFEVKLDLVKKFELTFSESNKWLTKRNSKYFISLKHILLNELKTYKTAKVETTETDTFVDHDFHSYRRDSSTKERNLSFAFLN